MSRRAWMMSLVLWPIAAAAQPASGNNDQTMLGMRLFNQSCRVCHTKPQLVSPQYGPVLSMNTLGGKADVMREVISNGTPRMPGFKYHFKPAEIDAIVAYIKTIPAPSDAPPPVKAGSVARRRLEIWRTPCAAGLIVTNLAAVAAILISVPAFADALLSGTIKSSDGKAMGGVTVSAKPDGGTITTTVFTRRRRQFLFSGAWPTAATGSGRRR